MNLDDFFETTSYNVTPNDWRDVAATASDEDDAIAKSYGTELRKRMKGRTLPPVDRNRVHAKELQSELHATIAKFFTSIKDDITRQAVDACERLLAYKNDTGDLTKKNTTKEDVSAAQGMVDFSVLNKLPRKTQNTLGRIYADGGQQAIKISTAGVGTVYEDNDAWHQVHEDALDYAHFRSAEMVGMKYNDDGELVDNPDAKWAITDETREGIRSAIESVVSGDLPITTLPDTLRESYGFSDARASAIARTEFNKANGEGALAGYRANGIKLKVWLTSGDANVSDDCAANEDQGPIPIEEEFQSGDLTDPAHPNCRCSVSAHIDLADDGDTEE